MPSCVWKCCKRKESEVLVSFRQLFLSVEPKFSRIVIQLWRLTWMLRHYLETEKIEEEVLREERWRKV